jgi:undecaprenyl pyrophosphate synthase
MKFIVKNWPSFTVADLDVALADYSNRERRFGT